MCAQYPSRRASEGPWPFVLFRHAVGFCGKRRGRSALHAALGGASRLRRPLAAAPRAAAAGTPPLLRGVPRTTGRGAACWRRGRELPRSHVSSLLPEGPCSVSVRAAALAMPSSDCLAIGPPNPPYSMFRRLRGCARSTTSRLCVMGVRPRRSQTSGISGVLEAPLGNRCSGLGFGRSALVLILCARRCER